MPIKESMSIHGKEVLVVDDVTNVRMRCHKVLESLGMIVSEADSILTALTHLSEKLPHVIILDLHMPGKSGFDFLTIRSQSPKLLDIPVIVLSTAGDKESIHKAISLGATDYVLKPMNAATISQRVRKHVRGLDFLRRTFPADKLPTVAISVGSQITKVEATMLTIESPVRIEKNTRIAINPPVIKNTDVSGCPLISDSEPGRRGLSGRYVTHINVVGLSETIHKKTLKKKAS